MPTRTRLLLALTLLGFLVPNTMVIVFFTEHGIDFGRYLENWFAALPSAQLVVDLVISSVHKVVGSITQSAIVHLGHGGRLDEHVVDRCVTLVESTSPNSLLFGSLDAARRMAATRGRELVEETLVALEHTREAVREILKSLYFFTATAVSSRFH